MLKAKPIIILEMRVVFLLMLKLNQSAGNGVLLAR